MKPIHVALTSEIPNCPFTCNPVDVAIIGMCKHFFEKNQFLQYIEKGGRNCPLCKERLTWYAEVPNFQNFLGTHVSIQPVKLEGEHRIESHQETATLEEGTVLSLILLEKAATDTHQFLEWCIEKDPTATASLQAQLNYDPVDSESQVKALQACSLLVQRLYDSFGYRSCESIQDFVNQFLGDEMNFYLYTRLLKEADVYRLYKSAQEVMGKGETPQGQAPDGEKIIADAEFGQKMRAIMGIVVTVSFMIGIGRKIF